MLQFTEFMSAIEEVVFQWAPNLGGECYRATERALSSLKP